MGRSSDSQSEVRPCSGCGKPFRLKRPRGKAARDAGSELVCSGTPPRHGFLTAHDRVANPVLGSAYQFEQGTVKWSKEEAAKQLDESLRRLQTDHLDLIQHHEVIRFDDPNRIFAAGGAMEAVLEAKRVGKVRCTDPALE
jgi:Aldo/keto reductase family